jgi:hypothetical protein
MYGVDVRIIVSPSLVKSGACCGYVAVKKREMTRSKLRTLVTNE